MVSDLYTFMKFFFLNLGIVAEQRTGEYSGLVSQQGNITSDQWGENDGELSTTRRRISLRANPCLSPRSWLALHDQFHMKIVGTR